MSENEKHRMLEGRLEQIQQQGIDPKKDLWPNIESQIKRSGMHRDSKRPFWYGALAASVLIATFVSGWQLSTLRVVEKPVTGYYLLAAQMNAEQQRQLHSMRTGYETAGYHQLNGETEEQLTQLALAREQITKSLRESQGDPRLLELLRWVNEQELKLLNQSYTLTQRVQEI